MDKLDKNEEIAKSEGKKNQKMTEQNKSVEARCETRV